MDNENENSSVVTEENIKTVLHFIMRHTVLIAVSAILICLLSYIFCTQFYPKTYTSSVKMYASVDYATADAASANTEFTYSKSVIETYVNILRSSDYYDDISNQLNNEVTSADISNCITISAIDDTSLFYVHIETGSPELSYKIATAVSETASNYIKNIDEHSIINIVDDAYLPSKPSSPNVPLFAVLGFLAGGFIGLVIALIHDLYDIRIKSEDELRKRYSIPILSAIPNFSR